MTSRSHRSALAATLLIACSLTATACSGNNDNKDAAPSTAEKTAVSVNTDAISPPDLVVPPTMKAGFQGAIKDVTLDKCEPKEGPQTVKGTIKSTAASKMDYVVTVNWVQGTDVMGRGFALVRGVEPGKETPFEVKADIKRKSSACTVNVVRGNVDPESLKTAAADAAGAVATSAPAVASAAVSKAKNG